jgi:hypothetical protein
VCDFFVADLRFHQPGDQAMIQRLYMSGQLPAAFFGKRFPESQHMMLVPQLIFQRGMIHDEILRKMTGRMLIARGLNGKWETREEGVGYRGLPGKAECR